MPRPTSYAHKFRVPLDTPLWVYMAEHGEWYRCGRGGGIGKPQVIIDVIYVRVLVDMYMQPSLSSEDV